MTIEWSSFVSVGVEVIDEDNKILVAIVNRLERAVQADQGSDLIEDVLCDLADYFGSHFHREEYLMERHRFPDLERHREEHRNFERTLTRLITDYEIATAEAIDRTLSFLRRWLADHVCGSDYRLGQFLRLRMPVPEPAPGRFRGFGS